MNNTKLTNKLPKEPQMIVFTHRHRNGIHVLIHVVSKYIEDQYSQRIEEGRDTDKHVELTRPGVVTVYILRRTSRRAAVLVATRVPCQCIRIQSISHQT